VCAFNFKRGLVDPHGILDLKLMQDSLRKLGYQRLPGSHSIPRIRFRHDSTPDPLGNSADPVVDYTPSLRLASGRPTVYSRFIKYTQQMYGQNNTKKLDVVVVASALDDM